MGGIKLGHAIANRCEHVEPVAEPGQHIPSHDLLADLVGVQHPLLLDAFLSLVLDGLEDRRGTGIDFSANRSEGLLVGIRESINASSQKLGW